MPRIVDGDGGELIGYTDVWSVAPGGRVELKVSTTAERFDARLVRLRHGDPNPAGPGPRQTPVPSAIDGTYPGGRQPLVAGSHAVLEHDAAARTRGVWVWSARPAAGREQVVLDGGGVTLSLDAEGRPAVRCAGVTVSAAQPLRRERWTLVVASVADDELRLGVDGAVATAAASGTVTAGPIHLAAAAGPSAHLDGRLEAPFACERALATDELSPAALASAPPDREWDVRALRLVNAPTLAVTGRRWRDDTTDFRTAPDEYAAVHFHSDDLEDAGWASAASLRVPDDLPSGVYAFELRAGELQDHVPFVVRPGPPSGARLAVLLPTLTYQVYGNERMIAGGETGMAPIPPNARLDPADRWLAAHPGAGASCYDRHPDGDGVALVSLRRPIPNLRPAFTWWITEAPERFGADLYLVDWLEELGEPFDVITDHDLHAEGRPLLDRYRVVLTGTHPEYTTHAMLDALGGYLREGGRLMYLGGNGFYWVTTIDPERPWLAEVRRGVNGTRAWTSRPGELRHQTTGEQGGLWRYRGRDPNRLVGVGFASQSDAPDRAPGYARTPASRDEDHAWVFDGVDGDVFGEHGLYLGGAAGYEIDRHDPAHGSPPEAVVLATSSGRHPPSYLLVVEDQEVTIADTAGPVADRVRADVTYLPYPGGGAVFSAGSCSWCGSLSTNGYDNDVARITANVLRRFLD